MKVLMSGNEAIARGAYEHGVRFAAGYPGTPSTEIMETFARYEGVYAEWSPNEKVALEAAIGAAVGGEKAMAVMKHVGVNVAADPLFTVSYTGTNRALVIISADDPSMHSSQNEQDNRNYAKFAKVPMLEPSDSREAKAYIKVALDLSEEFDTPVFLRTTTRVAHSKSIVELEEPIPWEDKTGVKINAAKYVMVPGNARVRRQAVETRTAALKQFAEKTPLNRVEMGSREVGIITSGMPYNYAKDAFPDYSYLKLGMPYPLPEKLIRNFASKVKKLYVVEELDPFLEEQIKAMGIDVTGKSIFPFANEFDPGIVSSAISGCAEIGAIPAAPDVPPRPPNLCPGCPHRGVFYVLGKLGAFVSGDIGCYTLSFMKPLEGLHSTVCMGASIGMAHGMSKALGDGGKGRVVAVIGDSTFVHSGMTPLLNMAYNGSDAVVVICDNSTTAMTGMQEHPATGYTLQGRPAKKLDFAALAGVFGIENVETVDPFDLKQVRKVMKKELAGTGPSVVIAESPCVLFRRANPVIGKPLMVDPEKCNGCKLCLGLSCPPISWRPFSEMSEGTYEKKTKNQEGIAFIESVYCTGCTLCQQLCKAGAIVEEE
ncbi:MAG: indolepyruvate ferredoxin oxidoreductase subunit alpha [Syntrophales bacterium]|jgi:indolepyruvate ferredoxin oxidoreductase alpha subunit|nr:indolepyruvate ferredoxin oxidoreductase subunit alpha [Syntrophales bacterium]